MVNINSTGDKMQDLWEKQPFRGVLCWHCCHSFDNVPAYLPVKHTQEGIELTGYFCSWNCVKSYALEKRKSLSSIGLLAYKTYWKPTFCSHEDPCRCLETTRRGIPLAPPKEVLKAFGGQMSIDEYRKDAWIVVSWEYEKNNKKHKDVKPDVWMKIETPSFISTKKRTKPLYLYG